MDPTRAEQAMNFQPTINGSMATIPTTIWADLVAGTAAWLDSREGRRAKKRWKDLDLADPHAYLASQARDTSSEAYAQALENSVATRARVWQLLTMYPGGLTDEEQQTLLGMSPNTQRPRRLELVEAGLVADSGQRRLTTKGNRAIVWIRKVSDAATS